MKVISQKLLMARIRTNKGVRGYFKDCSYGQFTPFFDVVGPIKLPRKHAIYGAGNDRMDLLLADACATVDDLVDFAKYDANNDGIVDLVYIIYAGHSANYRNNKVSNIWPKSRYCYYLQIHLMVKVSDAMESAMNLMEVTRHLRITRKLMV